MNSDPHESAAWRAFGMLDADETAAFDAAMRQDPELKNAYREMENLTAAIAAVASVPVPPRAGQLESLQLRLGIGATRRTNWLGISGWAAAAVLAAVLLFPGKPSNESTIARHPGLASPAVAPQSVPEIRSHADGLVVENAGEVELIEGQEQNEKIPSVTASATEPAHPIVRVETKRLIQEIEVLRGQLENFQERDRARFEVVPDMAWPIVMRMSPPRSGLALVRETEAPPLTAMLGDALAAASEVEASAENEPAKISPTLASMSVEPSAIPIYDAARDNGTLHVRNLPATANNERYRLWVKTQSNELPIYVGELPNSGIHKSESFDFSLGATATIPSEFILTKGQLGQSDPPSASNIILQGPSLK